MDTTPANHFDLNGRTLIFTPDGHGRYSRSVQSVSWEDNIGRAVADGEEVQLQSFTVDFAGRRWGSFVVSRYGLITFGEPLGYSYEDSDNRFNTMSTIAGEFVTAPTISPLFKPTLAREGWSDRYAIGQHVAASRSQVVVTWITTEPFDYYVHGVPPDKPSRFQVVLVADGSIRFNYADVTLGDGVVGLFDASEVERGRLLANLADPRDSGLPGHLDVVGAAFYETKASSAVVLEFTLRDDVRPPTEGEVYSYGIHFDTDEPYWNHPVDWNDEDFFWAVEVLPSGEQAVRGQGAVRPLSSAAGNRIALLASVSDTSHFSAMTFAFAARFDNDSWVEGDDTPTGFVEWTWTQAKTDLSQGDRRFTRRQTEVFHYQSSPDLDKVVCHVIDTLGDEFDLFVFHSEFRVDAQESGAGFVQYGTNINVKGVGNPRDDVAPCGSGRLKGRWSAPVWMKSFNVLNANAREDERFDPGSMFFAHELTHAWTAYASYERSGRREPLHGNYCRCHWRPELHAPAAFPWDPSTAGPGGLMGGEYWRENGDGTFTRVTDYYGGGHSWLDLYAMGLANVSEVPDVFILRNLRPVNEHDSYGPHTGEKEIVSIEQLVGAEGPRIPSADQAQKDFNTAFVYLLELGQAPDTDLLRLHAEYRDKVVEHWSHVTGGRSQVTTTVPGGGGRRTGTTDRAWPDDATHP